MLKLLRAAGLSFGLIVGMLFATSASAQVQPINVGIQNCWLVQTPSPSANVDSYNVYLGVATGGPYNFRVTNVPVTQWQNSTTFPGDIFITCTEAGLDPADVGPPPNPFLDYFGVTTAVNIVGDESGFSNEFMARLHVPPGKPGNARITKTRP